MLVFCDNLNFWVFSYSGFSLPDKLARAEDIEKKSKEALQEILEPFAGKKRWTNADFLQVFVSLYKITIPYLFCSFQWRCFKYRRHVYCMPCWLPLRHRYISMQPLRTRILQSFDWPSRMHTLRSRHIITLSRRLQQQHVQGVSRRQLLPHA